MDLTDVRPILRAMATTIVPEMSSLSERAWSEVEHVIRRGLAERSPRAQRGLFAFVRLLQVLPIARYGRPFTSLTSPRRDAFLASIERSQFLVIRRRFLGIRSLVFMGYYSRDDVAESIGYRAVRGGWEARGGTVATVPLAPALWVEP